MLASNNAVSPWPPNGTPVTPAPESAGGAFMPPVMEPPRTVLLQKLPGQTVPQPGTLETMPVQVIPPTPADVTPPVSGLILGLPTREDVFRLDGEEELEQRIIKDLKRNTSSRQARESEFEDLPPLTPPGIPYTPKTVAYPPIKMGIEAGYVVHRRLYFEEKNAERYGWDAGLAQPLFSTLYFYGDTLLWPLRLASNPHERYDTNLGKCLPGSPVPYYIYPPEVDVYGALFGAGFYTGIGFIFP